MTNLNLVNSGLTRVCIFTPSQLPDIYSVLDQLKITDYKIEPVSLRSKALQLLSLHIYIEDEDVKIKVGRLIRDVKINKRAEANRELTPEKLTSEHKDCLAKIDDLMGWWEERFDPNTLENDKHYQALKYKRWQVATGKKLPSEI